MRFKYQNNDSQQLLQGIKDRIRKDTITSYRNVSEDTSVNGDQGANVDMPSQSQFVAVQDKPSPFSN